MTYYLLTMWRGVEPSLMPLPTDETARDDYLSEFFQEHFHEEDSYCMLVIPADGRPPSVSPFSGEEMDQWLGR